jgi:CDGSH-type Zn-finger protein
MIKNFAKCGCGRSVSGFCDGSHALTVEEYTVQLMSRTPEYTLFPETDSEKPIPYAST